MKITEITYSRGQTLQLRQFEPVNIHFSAKAEVDEDSEGTFAAYEHLKKVVDEQVAIQTEMLQGNTGKIVRAAAQQVIAKEASKPKQPIDPELGF